MLRLSRAKKTKKNLTFQFLDSSNIYSVAGTPRGENMALVIVGQQEEYGSK